MDVCDPIVSCSDDDGGGRKAKGDESKYASASESPGHHNIATTCNGVSILMGPRMLMLLLLVMLLLLDWSESAAGRTASTWTTYPGSSLSGRGWHRCTRHGRRPLLECGERGKLLL